MVSAAAARGPPGTRSATRSSAGDKDGRSPRSRTNNPAGDSGSTRGARVVRRARPAMTRTVTEQHWRCPRSAASAIRRLGRDPWHTGAMAAQGRNGSGGPAPSLGEFLRERRMRLQPEEVGISRPRSQGSSADPGLRREEVADLADISVAYYTFIERGRDVRPSKEVLRSIGRAMVLTEGAR